jgi:hypothetical protein
MAASLTGAHAGVVRTHACRYPKCKRREKAYALPAGDPVNPNEMERPRILRVIDV